MYWQDSWHKSFADKLKNWRKRGKLEGEEITENKAKYQKQGLIGAEQANLTPMKKQKGTKPSGSVSDEQINQVEKVKSVSISIF